MLPHEDKLINRRIIVFAPARTREGHVEQDVLQHAMLDCSLDASGETLIFDAPSPLNRRLL